MVVGAAVFTLLGLLPALYPTGELPSRGWLFPASLVMLGALMLEAQWLLHTLGAGWHWPLDHESPNTVLVWLPFGVYVTGALLAWAWCLVRLLRATRPERQQLAWLLVAVASILVLPALGSSTTAQALQALSLYLLPAAIAVGVLRYRLLGIETVLRRGLVYAVLTAAVVGVHAGVTYLGEAWWGVDRIPSVAAAAVVAVFVLPMRERVQRAVDRLLFGRRQEPLFAVSVLSDRLAAAQPSELLDAVVGEIRAALRSGGVQVLDADGRPLARTGRDPEPGDGSVLVPLVIGGEPSGELVLAPRGTDETYSSADLHLVRALAPQVALAVRLVGLATGLEGERDRVLSVRRDERERLRRDLHDGLGPSMTGIGLGLQALDDFLLTEDFAGGREVTSILQGEVAATVREVRRIVDGLRPGQVESIGLVAALRQAVAVNRDRPRVELHLEEVTVGVDVQDTVYRVALEALNNAVRHADAGTVRVTLRQDRDRHPEHLVLEVGDDGGGIAPGRGAGVGLASMQALAESAGGHLDVTSTGRGTLVRLVLPVSCQPVVEGAS